MAHRSENDRPAPEGGALLVIDVGNSRTKLGLAREGRLLRVWSARTRHGGTRDEAVAMIRSLTACPGEAVAAQTGAVPSACDEPGALAWSDAVVASVVPDLTDPWSQAARQLTGRRPLVVGPGIKTGVPMTYHDPAELGADRVADLAAAMADVEPPFIVVDLGTTTNLEVVDGSGRFVGGIIAPGLHVAAQAASNAAAKLPSVDLRAPRSAIGKNTREAMQSGFVLGEAAMIDGLVACCWDELGCTGRVIVAGENARAMAALCRSATGYREHLTLEGLVRLYSLNR